MARAVRIALGAPGVYAEPRAPEHAFGGVRMDVCAFAGVAPRGPARVPVVDETWTDESPCVEPERPRRRTVAVALESFEEYRRVFGGFEGPGLLPYAVQSFFQQGGRRAYAARIVHDYGDAGSNTHGVAQGELPGLRSRDAAAVLWARNEGSWGNRLRVALEYLVRPLVHISATREAVSLPKTAALVPGALLRLTLPGGVRELRFAGSLERRPQPLSPGETLHARFDRPASLAPDSLEWVEGALSIDDGDGRVELHQALGFSPAHPRWLASVLCYQSALLYPDPTWIDAELWPIDAVLASARVGARFRHGLDRYHDITRHDFVDRGWTLGDDEPGEGVHCFAGLSDLSLLVAPDLYSPRPLDPPESVLDPISLAGPNFATCVDLQVRPKQQERAEDELEGLRLDPRLPADLERIAAIQAELVEFAEQQRSFAVLLDVPPGLVLAQILRWRERFDSSFAAAYHPWLLVAPVEDSRAGLVRLPPSAAAAGIIAERELSQGIAHGPANRLADGAVDVDERVSGPHHDQLHQAGLNVYLLERDGVRLSAARTLSHDPSLRQLSVRRLITMLMRALEQQMQWTVFEPHTTALRAELRQSIQGYLRTLYRGGALRGASEEEAFFVRCDEALNPQPVIDAGRLLVEIGVAPAEPLEFIVLRIVRADDGSLSGGA